MQTRLKEKEHQSDRQWLKKPRRRPETQYNFFFSLSNLSLVDCNLNPFTPKEFLMLTTTYNILSRSRANIWILICDNNTILNQFFIIQFCNIYISAISRQKKLFYFINNGNYGLQIYIGLQIVLKIT